VALTAPSRPRRAGKAGLSLKGRALQWLAQREQSRVELRRKLMRYALDEALAAQAGSASSRLAVPHSLGAPDAFDALSALSALDPCTTGSATGNPGTPDPVVARASAAEQVETLLDWLEANRYLSAERFVESRVNARAGRFGNLRIRHELKQHHVVLCDEAAQALRDSELERANAVRERKFAAWPETAAERARQARFLAGRGFSPETIGRALRDAAGEGRRANCGNCAGDTVLGGANRRSD
jgi:regulatory protein